MSFCFRQFLVRSSTTKSPSALLPLYLNKICVHKTKNPDCTSRRLSSTVHIDQGPSWTGRSKAGSSLLQLRTQYPDIVTWYACGPTVYDSAHIGHASSYIRLDVIRRILERQNITVLQVMGVTDIDDKIIARAKQLDIPWKELAKKYELEFFNDLTRLKIKMPHVKARVSEFIPNIVQFVSELISSGLAYPTSDGSVYFNTTKYGAYGKFRQLNEEDEDTSEENETEKKNPRDFAVWKGQKPGEPYWDTEWGRGRPGWHIECSVMASHFFGTTLDLHSGGKDLIFPHHENEEAQCCAKFGQNQWVSHWIHTGHLIVKGDVKMSKSLGNTITIDDFLQNNSAESLRMMCVLSPHGNTLEYSNESRNHAVTVLRKIKSFIGDCNSMLLGQQIAWQTPESHSILWSKIVASGTQLTDALTNNFDTPRAIGILLELISDFRHNIKVSMRPTDVSGVDLAFVLRCKLFAEDFLDQIGISNALGETNKNELLLDSVLAELLNFRKVVRNYSLAVDEENKTARKLKMKERLGLTEACDDIRRNLKTLGVEVKDAGQESSWSLRSDFA